MRVFLHHEFARSPRVSKGALSTEPAAHSAQVLKITGCPLLRCIGNSGYLNDLDHTPELPHLGFRNFVSRKRKCSGRICPFDMATAGRMIQRLPCQARSQFRAPVRPVITRSASLPLRTMPRQRMMQLRAKAASKTETESEETAAGTQADAGPSGSPPRHGDQPASGRLIRVRRHI